MTKSSIRLCILTILVSVAVSAAAQSNQTPSQKRDTPEEMQALLAETAKNYREANSLRIEREMEGISQADLSLSWVKSFSKVTLASGNRYRREDKSAETWEIHQSDGTTEWKWYPWRKQYVEQPLDKSSESLSSNPAEGGWVEWLKEIDKKLAGGKLQPSEIIEIWGRQVNCMVIVGPPSPRGFPDPSMKQQTTYWIDLDRKLVAKEQFAMRSTVPKHKVDYVYTTTYNIVELNPSLSESLFKFFPPEGAERIADFERGPVALVGKPAPPLKLKTLDGKDFDLVSLLGKPVIIDFWATWCMPCRKSMPQVAKLYEEFKAMGLNLVSVSLDEDPADAARFVMQRKYSWTMVADPSSSSSRDWGESAIPRVVLIGKDGKVWFDVQGFDDEEEPKLRSALHKMDPSFPGVYSNEK
jgi:cytochrome c biogenesis protein CcmG/thiol:disulfide interchange protein DsbE